MAFTGVKESPRTDQAPPLKGASAVVEGRAHFEGVTSVLERLADIAAIMIAVLFTYALYEWLGVGRRVHYSAQSVLADGFAFAVVFVFMLDRAGAYTRGSSLLLIRETERVLRVTLQSFGLVFVYSFFLGHLYSRWAIVIALGFVPFSLLIEKQLVRHAVRHLYSRGYGVQNVLIYGVGVTARRVFSALARSPRLGLNPVAMIDDGSGTAGHRIYEYGYGRERFAPVFAGPLTASMIEDFRATLVIDARESSLDEDSSEIAAEAFAGRANVAAVPRSSEFFNVLNEYVDIDGVLIGSLGPVRPRLGYEWAKRTFDVFIAGTLMIIIAPVWAIVAILIRRDSAGPVFFQQQRVGLRGKEFRLYKFRTMRTDAPQYALHPTGIDDARITRLGRWLRRTSLDELPQLLNVLKGDMSLVGPRPEMPFIVEQYNEQQRQRLQVQPGITGLWQISADRMFLIHENIQYDLYYIRHCCFFMDIAILLHTALFAARGV